MSYNAGNVPLIAITTEENDYEAQEENNLNIEETLTDTEELYISTEQKKKKKSKKPTPKPDLYATDTEDFEGSDNEISVSLVKHEAPIDIADVINASSPTYEEVANDNVKGGRDERKKLRTQTSVISCGRYLDTDEADSCQILTDTEEFDKSDDEGNVSEAEENDNEILEAMMNDGETIAISDRSKRNLNGTPSPSVTPVPGLSDHEWLQCSKVSQRAFSLGSTRLTTPNTGDANDVTDTETLLYDSDGQVYGKKQRAKIVKTRKRASANKPTSNLTDSDDVDESDNDQKIVNRLAPAGHSSKATGATARKSIYRPCTPTNCFAPIGTFGNEPESDDDSMFPGDKKPKAKKVSTLKVNTDAAEGVTDTEDLDFEYCPENEIESDVDVPYYADGIDSCNGVIEEKLTSKEKFRVCNVETSVVHKNKKSSIGQEQNDTDEEVCEGDVTPEWTVKDPAEFTINLNFVTKNNSRSLQNKSSSSITSTNLLAPGGRGEEGALTEVEDLESADEGRGGLEIPMTVINKGTYDDQTDTESVEGEIDWDPVTTVPDSFLPPSGRKIVTEKMKKDNTYEVIVTKDNNEEDDLDEGASGIKYALTDVEEFSGDDDMLDEDVSKAADIKYDITAPDEGVVQQEDKLKVPDPHVTFEGETDTEEITGISEKKIQKHYLQAHRKNTGKLTDTEDFEISDAENLDDEVITLRVSTLTDDAAAGKTDVEDFTTSDNENNDAGPIERSVTPDVLHEMGGETICTKEGMGKFTKQERKKLNKINLSQTCATPVSPTQTDTDDCIASADDESYSRAETATPLQMHQELDEAGNFRIHSQNLKKADLEAEDEVMYLKGGGYVLDVFTDVEEMGISDEEHLEKNNALHNSAEPNVTVHFKKNENQVFLSYADKEWSSSEAQPAVEQPASRQTTLDAAQSDTGAVHKDGCIRYHRNFGNGCNESQSISPFCHSLDTVEPLSYYNQLDQILDHMLAEVNEHERIESLNAPDDHLQPVCVNSIHLYPPTDALIELPLPSPKSYQTSHEIIITGDEASTLDNTHLSLESLTDPYFMENIKFTKHKASAESLNDNTLDYFTKSEPEHVEHVYEIIDGSTDKTSRGCLPPNDNNIWWEGTYRDLSVVPEEEDYDDPTKSEVTSNDFHIDTQYYYNLKISSVEALHTDGNEPSTSSGLSEGSSVDSDTTDNEHDNIPISTLLVSTGKDTKLKKTNKVVLPVKPSGTTLQRLLVRCPENTTQNEAWYMGTNPIVQNSRPVCVMQKPETPTGETSRTYVDLYTNIPFHPTYSLYNPFETQLVVHENENDPIPSTSFPSAYCDWFEQPDDLRGGVKSPTPTDFCNNEDKVNLRSTVTVTDDKIIHDVLSKDLKPTIQQTSMFINMESQVESQNLSMQPSITDSNKLSELSTPPKVVDKSSKELDNKKERSKGKGFFSSLKSFVGKSHEGSDTEMKEEKSPKKKKRKEKKTEQEQDKNKATVSPINKPKYPSPKPEKKAITVEEFKGVGTIPSIDDTNASDKYANDKSQIDKLHEINIECTVTPEELRKSTEPILINEDEFVVVFEENLDDKPDDKKDIKSDSKTVSEPHPIKQESKEYESDADDKEHKSKKSLGFLKMFGKKESKESDDETQIDHTKPAVKPEEEKVENKQDEQRRSVGFFSIFSKKSKKDSEEEPEKQEDVKPKPPESITAPEKFKNVSEEVQQQMIDSAHFLLREIELFEDVKIVYEKPPEQVTALEKDAPKATFVDEAPLSKTDKKEIKPEDKKPKDESKLDGKKPKEESKADEKKKKEDVKLDDKKPKEEKKLKEETKIEDKKEKEESKGEEKKQSGGFFGIFGKKQKQDSEEEKKESANEIDDVQVKAKEIPVTASKEQEVHESKPDQKEEEPGVIKSFFGMFSKKSKDEPQETEKELKEQEKLAEIESKLPPAKPIEFSHHVQQHMIDSARFIFTEIEFFDDVKIKYDQVEKTKADTSSTEPKEKEKTPSEDELPTFIEFSKDVQQQIVDAAHFLLTEVEFYDDVKLRKTAESEKDKTAYVISPTDYVLVDSLQYDDKKIIDSFVSDHEDTPPEAEKEDTQPTEDFKPKSVEKQITEEYMTTDEESQSTEEIKKESKDKTTSDSEASDSKHGFFSKLGERFGARSPERKSAADHKQRKKHKAPKDGKKSKGFFSKLGEKLSGTSQEVQSGVKSAAATVKEEMDTAADKTKTTVATNLKDMEKSAKDVKNETESSLQDTKTVVQQKLDTSVEKTKEQVSDISKKAQEKATALREATEIQAKQAADASKEKLHETKKATEKAVDKVGEKMQDAKSSIKETSESAKEAITDKATKVKDKVTDVKTQASEKATTLVQDIDTKFQKVATTYKHKVTDAKETTAEMKDSIQEQIQSKVTDAQNDIDNAQDETKDTIIAAKLELKTTTDEITNATNELKAKVPETEIKVVSIVEEKITNVEDKLEDAQSGFGKAKEFGQDKLQSVQKTMKHVADESNELLQNAQLQAQKTKDDIGNKLKDTEADIELKAEKATEQVKDATDNLKTGVLQKKSQVVDGLNEGITKLADVSKEKVTAVKETATAAKEHVDDKVMEAKSDIVEKTKVAKDKIEGVKSDIAKKAEVLKDDVKAAKTDLAEKAEAAKENIAAKTEIAKDKIKATESDIAGKAEVAKEKIAEKREMAKEKIKDVATGIVETAQVAKDKIAEKTKTAEDKIKDAKTDITQKTEAVKDKIADKSEKAQEKIQDAKTDLAEKAETVKDAIAEKTEMVKEKLKDAKTDIAQKTEVAKDKIADKTEKAKEKIQDAKTDLAEKTEAAKDTIAKETEMAKEKLQDAKTDIAQKVVAAKDKIAEKTEMAKGKIKDAKTDIAEKAEAAKDTVVEKTEMAKEKLQDVKTDIAQKTEAAKGTISEKTQIAKGKVEDAKTDIAEKAEAAKGTVVEKTEMAKEKLKHTKTDIAEKTEAVKDKITEKTEMAKEKMKDAKTDFAEKSESAKDKIKDGVTSVSTRELAIVQGIGKSIKDSTESAKESVGDAKEKAGVVKESVEDGIQSVKEDILEKAVSGKEKTMESARDVKEKVTSKSIEVESALEKQVDSSKAALVDAKKATEAKVGDVESKLKHAKTEVIQKTETTKEHVKDTAGGIKGKLTSIGKAFGDTFHKGGKSVVDTSKQKISDTKKDVEKAEKVIKTKTKDAKQDVAQKVGSVKEKAKDVKDQVLAKEEEVKESIEKSAKTTVDGAKQKMHDAKKESERIKEDAQAKIVDVNVAVAENIEYTKDKTQEKLSDLKTQISATGDKLIGTIETKTKEVEETTKETLLDAKKAAKGAKEDIQQNVELTKGKIQDTASDVSEKIQLKEMEMEKGIKVVIDASKQRLHDTKKAKDSVETSVKDKVEDTKAEIVEKEKGAVEGIKETATDIKEKLNLMGETVQDATKTHLKEAIDTSKQKISDAKVQLKDVKESAEDKVRDTQENIAKKTEHVKEKIAATAADAKSKILEGTQVFEQSIKGELQQAQDKSKKVVEDVKESKEKASDYLQDKLKETKTEIQHKTDSSLEAAKEKLTDVKTGIIGKASAFGDFMKTGADKVESATKQTVSDAKEKTDKTGHYIQENITEAKSQVKDKIQTSVGETKEAVHEVKSKVSEKQEALKEDVKHTVDFTKEKLTAAQETVKQKLQDTQADIAEKNESTKKEITDTATNVKTKMGSMFGAFTDNISKGVQKATEVSKEKLTDAKKGAESIKESMDDKVQEVKLDVSQRATDIKQKTEIGKDAAKEKITEIKSEMLEKVTEAQKSVDGAKESVTDKIKDVQSGILEAGENTKEHMHKTVSDAKEKVSEKTKDVFDATKEKLDDTKQKTDKLKYDVEDKIQKVKSDIAKESDLVKEKAGVLKDKVGVLGMQLGESTGKAVEVVTDFSKEKIKSVEKQASKVKDKVESKTKDTLQKADSVKEQGQEKIKDVISTAGISIGETIHQGVDSTKQLMSEAKQATSKVDQKVDTTLEQIKDSFSALERDTKDISKSEIQKEKEVLISPVEEKKEGIFDKVKALPHELKSFTEKSQKSVTDTFSKVSDKLHKSPTEKKPPAEVPSTKVPQEVISPRVEIHESVDAFIPLQASNVEKERIEKQFDEILEEFHGDKSKLQKETESFRMKSSPVIPEEIETGTDLNIRDVTGEFERQTSKTSSESKKSGYTCYVTTPTMQRRGVGGSQRLPLHERPALRDVSNMPLDMSSDEDEYIVTEPTEKKYSGRRKESDESPVVMEYLESESGKPTQSPSDGKRRPLFHIGSKEEESVDWGDKSDAKLTEFLSMHSEVTDTTKGTHVPDISKESAARVDVQADIESIESKLSELGKALDNLEQANIEIDTTEPFANDALERKLHRVERKFERMASETMDQDLKEAKEKHMLSPEVEQKREEEFRKMVSQLSQDEVSEYQKLFSTVWDEATFSPSDEFNSKTPDSQAGDVPELPQGEVVYMGPVTLNKDISVNKAGIEIDIIPVKRSPCTSPLPKKKLQNKGRAKSAMGFYDDRATEERGSLPDLQSTGKSLSKSPLRKGEILSAIMKFEPDILKDTSGASSTPSLYFNSYSNGRFSRRQSTESLSRGTVLNAVKEWMARCSPFDSSENLRSTGASSLADTALSLCGDIDDIDDFDSVGTHSDTGDCVAADTSARALYDPLPTFELTHPGTGMGSSLSLKRRTPLTVDPFSLGETSSGLLTKLTSQVSAPHVINTDESTATLPRPVPRTDKTPDTQLRASDSTETESTDSEQTTETYLDKKKFWENVTNANKDTDRPEHPAKKRFSLYEEQVQKPEAALATKRQSVHELSSVPPVPKPRTSVLAHTSEETHAQIADATRDEDREEEQEVAQIEDLPDDGKEIISEYKAAFRDPTKITEPAISAQDTAQPKPKQSEKAESLDSEAEYLKYEAHQIYDNSGYISDEHDQDTVDVNAFAKPQQIPQVKRRQMSISQPPVAAVRKTIFERSVSLPSDDLHDVCDNNVKARKQFFEQQIKNEMVIDQLRTQLEEEELPEYKTLTDTKESKAMPAKGKTHEPFVPDVEKDLDYERDLGKDLDKKLSPISSSSSQDTKTEDDITQYTPTSVKDLTKYFQAPFVPDTGVLIRQRNGKFEPTSSPDQTTEEDVSRISIRKIEQQQPLIEQEQVKQLEITSVQEEDEMIKTSTRTVEKESSLKEKQPSTESDQTISSERSIELGSGDEMPSHVTEVLQYKSDSTSKPSDSLEVHVDKSEIEDSEKVAELEQDVVPDTESKPSTEEMSSSVIKQSKHAYPDTVWEVPILSQPISEIEETVTEIPIDKQIIVEKDEELSGSVRDESDLGSEIHQDHSESYESEHVRSGSHSEVEQLILESLYHQKIRPEEARKIASELIDDIEAEVQKRQLMEQTETSDHEPPVPDPDVAKNQISDYLRQLAESKGLDAKEVQLVESVLARKQSELFRLSRRDTQTSSMEITDEDLKYSGADYSISPSDSQDVLDEQIEQLESESKPFDFKEKEMHYETSSVTIDKNILFEQEKELYDNDAVVGLKVQSETKEQAHKFDETQATKEKEQTFMDGVKSSTELDEQKQTQTKTDQIQVMTDVEVQGDTFKETEKSEAVVLDDEKQEVVKRSTSKETHGDGVHEEETVSEEKSKTSVALEGTLDSVKTSQKQLEDGSVDTVTREKSAASSKVDEESHEEVKHSQKVTVSDDGLETHSSDIIEEVNVKSVRSTQIIDETRKETTTVTTSEHIDDIAEELDDLKSPTELIPLIKKDESDLSRGFDKPDVILRKTKLRKDRKDRDSSSSSGNLKSDRKSGTDFEAYSSSGESHYHSFEQDSAKSRPCSSDVEGLMAAGSSEYESALTSQEISSRSHLTSTEYHTAVSSLSSRESMKSLDSESSGNMASVEVSEASETLVPSTFELEGDILDGAMGQLLEDEVVEGGPIQVLEPYDRDIPEHVIRGEIKMKEKKSSFDTISDSEVQGESIDISEEDSTNEKSTTADTTCKMKRSQEMTFQPEPKMLMADSPQSEAGLEMDERFGSSLEDGSVLSVSLSSTSDATALRTVIEQSRSERLDESLVLSDSMTRIGSFPDETVEPRVVETTDSSTSTTARGLESLNSVTITTSSVTENGAQSVSTQVTSQRESLFTDVYNGPTQVDYVPEYDDVQENKKVKGHRRQESTSAFIPSKIPIFPTCTAEPPKPTEVSQVDQAELTPKEVHSDEHKDVDETEFVPENEELETEKPAVDTITPDARILEKPRKSISEFEEAEAEAAFSMVAHISPAHKAKGDICPILEDEDAEKHELETKERTQKELEERIAQMARDKSPTAIPDIKVTEHMTPLVDREFHYPDLELQEQEALEQKLFDEAVALELTKTPKEKLDEDEQEIVREEEQILMEKQEIVQEKETKTEAEVDASKKDTKAQEPDVQPSTSQQGAEKKLRRKSEPEEPGSTADSPNSDSFEMLEKPDIIDDFVVIEEVAKEAAEHDSEGKSVQIKPVKYIRKHDEEVEEYLVRSAPTPLTRMTDLKYYPDGTTSDDLGPFDFEDSPPLAARKAAEGKDSGDISSARTYGYEYDRELEASKKWIEMQFQGDQQAMISAGYGYEMEFERGPLEDIKEEEATDFESSRIGSLDSTKQSIGSLGSVKDSFSSTPEYDVLAGRKFFTRSGEHDDVSMSSLQEFEHLERVISLENRRHHQGSQDSSSNGSFSRRYHAGRSGQGDDVSLSSLKEFEGLESACIQAHNIEVKAKEEEALLTQIDEAQENLVSESESCMSVSSVEKKVPSDTDEDYDKRMFEIEEIIRQAQTNVEKFIDIVDRTESIGRGDSLEEVAKVPDLELDEPIVRSTVHTVKWSSDDVMQTSTDSLDLKPSHHASTDSLDMKATAADLMTASTDSIEYQVQSRPDRDVLLTDSIELPDQERSCMITSDSLELPTGAQATNLCSSDSIDDDGSRIVEGATGDQSISSGRADDLSLGKDEVDDQQREIQSQRAEFLLGSTDSLDPSSSTATHATYQYETDSVMSGSFTSGGSNTMVSSTDTIDPLAHAHGTDLAAAVRKVWFDDDSFSGGAQFTAELLDDGSKPFVTEVIEPCEDDPEYSHTVHRKIELPPEIKKITFKGPDADLKLRQYIENFGEGEDMQETQETDQDGNVHIKRVVQKRFIVKADESGQETRMTGPEIETYLQNLTRTAQEGASTFSDLPEPRLVKQTHTNSDGTKTIYVQKFGTKYSEGQEESAVKQLLSSIASDVSESVKHHVDNKQESSQSTQAATSTVAGEKPSSVVGVRRKPLRYEISIDDQTEVDPREHDWRFNLTHSGDSTEGRDDTASASSQQRGVADQHQLSAEMKDLLAEMEKQAKQ